jgi:ABC-type iron transport system FetAB ATPase subunit
MAAVEALIATRVQSGLAVLWVTHDADQARRIANRLLVVKGVQVRKEVPEWQATSP